MVKYLSSFNSCICAFSPSYILIAQSPVAQWQSARLLTGRLEVRVLPGEHNPIVLTFLLLLDIIPICRLKNDN